MSYTKGAMGHMLDMRQAMGEICEASREWCAAFDVGDSEAMEHLGGILQEALGALASGAGAINADVARAQKKGQGGR